MSRERVLTHEVLGRGGQAVEALALMPSRA
jgi:hypothetical protein